jgi:hypothetical protein
MFQMQGLLNDKCKACSQDSEAKVGFIVRSVNFDKLSQERQRELDVKSVHIKVEGQQESD